VNEQFSLGKVLGTTFRVWVRNLVPFVLLTAVVYLPLIIYTTTVVKGGVTLDNYGAVITHQRYLIAFIFPLNTLASAALTYGVVMELQGKRASIVSCVATGLVRFFPAFVVGILVSAITFAGAIALIVPGVVAMCVWYIAVQASVIERPGVLGALRRSSHLTAGHRLEIFGAIFVMLLLSFGTAFALNNAMVPDPKNDLAAYLGSLPAFMYANVARLIVIGSLWSVMGAVTYFYLRQEKEGTTAAELAKVFE
jgi:hypothetical protein